MGFNHNKLEEKYKVNFEVTTRAFIPFDNSFHVNTNNRFNDTDVRLVFSRNNNSRRLWHQNLIRCASATALWLIVPLLRWNDLCGGYPRASSETAWISRE